MKVFERQRQKKLCKFCDLYNRKLRSEIKRQQQHPFATAAIPARLLRKR